MTGVLSYTFAALSFTALTLLLAVSRQQVRQGRLLVFASFCTVLWAASGIWTSIFTSGYIILGGFNDCLRILAWALFIDSLMDRQAGRQAVPKAGTPPTSLDDSDSSSTPELATKRRIQWSFRWFMGLLLCSVLAVHTSFIARLVTQPLVEIVLPSLWLIAALSGLVMLERLYVSSTPERKRTIQTLCIGLGGMFVLDFFIFTDTLLFRRINLDLWQVRGFFYGALTPFIALSISRNPDWSLQLHVSRQAVTSSVTLIAAGAYLSATAAAAYFIRASNLEWASVAQIALVLLALLLLVMLLLSRKLRATTRVLISKHLFSYKYDYRHEWLKFTGTLAKDPANAGASILLGMTGIVESDSGILWARDRDGQFEILASKEFAHLESLDSTELDSLTRFMDKTGWIVQMDEYRESPEHYQGLTLPDSLVNDPLAWLIVPLPTHDGLAGMLLIARSSVVKSLNWEDRDLLKTAGNQASTLLVYKRSSDALTEARQFEAFSKMSAYIVHDLKNIVGQQSLIVSNSKKHKHKPEFVDDVIATIDNSVNRMQSLLEQLRNHQNQTHDQQIKNVDLCQTLKDATDMRSRFSPKPALSMNSEVAFVSADEEKLHRVFAHLIHNAQDATSNDGTIKVTLQIEGSQALISVSDTGHGMSRTFIKESLFKPFNSTKGLTGMGIGAYESREYVRSIGGTLSVRSNEGQGSVFEVALPLLTNPIEH